MWDELMLADERPDEIGSGVIHPDKYKEGQQGRPTVTDACDILLIGIGEHHQQAQGHGDVYLTENRIDDAVQDILTPDKHGEAMRMSRYINMNTGSATNEILSR